MRSRIRNHGLEKICNCQRSRWPKCPHAWYFRFKPRGGHRFQFSLDAELGRHIGSKTEAENEATKIRVAILAGTFRRAGGAASPLSSNGITLDQFAPIYIERASKASGKRTWKEDDHRLALLREHRTGDGRRLGDVALTAITEDELEAFHSEQRAVGRATSTLNHLIQTVKAAFRWATKKGYISRSPVSEDSALKRGKVAQRRRRLSPDEERAILDAAGVSAGAARVRLQWLIIAALETGCRVGELLALQWADVDLSRRTVYVRAVEEGARKAGRSRLLPMSARLGAVLEMAKTDPAGRRYPPTAYVFGQFGGRVRSVKKAWETAVLKAHGHEPAWKGTSLSPKSQEAYRAIDLHFHDLRHEAGCRWLEAGWPIHHVQEMLGHANLSQTSTYLHAAEMGLQESMKRFDAVRAETQADLRGESVVNKGSIAPQTVHHEKRDDNDKALLH
jgi:integrase